MRPNNYTQGAQVQRQTARADSIPAPIGGWNARDSLAAMAPTDAVTLTNLFPTQSSVNLRGGSSNWATGMSGAVETIMTYYGGATAKMFAIDAIGKKIYDVTVQGAVGAPVVTGLANARWKSNNIATPGGHFMYSANGDDRPLLYDGTTWTPIDGGSSPAITGVTTTLLNTPFLHMNRQWFIENNSLRTWYLPTQSIGGAANFLDMSAYCTKGGYLVDAFSWTIDAGYGLDDMLGFITSNGQIVIWRGTDPASAATWTLVGVWDLGTPIGTRCSIKWGGDVLLLTQDGIVPMAQYLQSSRLDPRVALSNKIQLAVNSAIQSYGGNFGWQLLYYAPQNAIMLNVPVTATTQQQYVMNTVTNAWCNFTNWAASCITSFKDVLYYGGNGTVVEAWDETFADLGENTNTFAQQAFNYFEARGVLKHFTRARPMITTNVFNPPVLIGINTDFNLINIAEPLDFSITGALWDSAVWDVSAWAQGPSVSNFWQGVTGVGYCGSIQFQSASMGATIQWAATDVVYMPGWMGI